MSLDFIIRPEVATDLAEAFEWYEGRVAGLGLEFIRTVDSVFSSIIRNPQAYPVVYKTVRAVKRARLAFYNQETHEYEFFLIDQPLEIRKLVGDVSLKDGHPFIHAHITLADKAGKAYGGHLAPAKVIFACEFILEVFDG